MTAEIERSGRDKLYAMLQGALPQHLLGGEEGVGGLVGPIPIDAATEAPPADPPQLLERPTEAPVGEHPLDAVGGLSHVLKHHDGASQIR